jgi:hypothetical protein
MYEYVLRTVDIPRLHDNKLVDNKVYNLFFLILTGNLQKKVSINLPSNACGVRTAPLNETAAEPDDEEDLFYSVELVVQMESKLQQSADQELIVK